MNISSDTVFLSSDHKRDLTVGFQSHQSVDYMTAGLFQHLSPYNIILFIKSCFKLYQNGNLFPVFCCLRQRCDDRRITADTIQGLFDRQHILISCRLPDKINYRCKGFIRMEQQNILLSDLLKDIAVRRKIRYWLGRCIGFFLKVIITGQSIHFHQESKIERSVNPVNIIIRNGKLPLDDAKQPCIHSFFHFQSDGLPPLTLFQLFFNLLKQILCFVLLNGQICVSHDTKRIRTDDFIV